MAGPIVVTITGVRETLYVLSVEITKEQAAATAALVAAAELIRDRARTNAAAFRYSGRLEAATNVKGPTIIKGVTFVTVGVHGEFAPEGKTFETGWRSKSGLRPPSKSLEAWAESKGIADPKRAAFVIARAIGARGYSFGERHWLSSAFAEVGPAATGMVAAAVEGGGFITLGG